MIFLCLFLGLVAAIVVSIFVMRKKVKFALLFHTSISTSQYYTDDYVVQHMKRIFPFLRIISSQPIKLMFCSKNWIQEANVYDFEDIRDEFDKIKYSNNAFMSSMEEDDYYGLVNDLDDEGYTVLRIQASQPIKSLVKQLKQEF